MDQFRRIAQNRRRVAVAGSTSRRRLSVRAAVCALLSASAGPAIGAESPRGATQLEEIVVTATRREVELQSVPVTVTAIGAADINDRSILNLGDFLFDVPGVQFNQGEPNSSRFSIRGLTTDSATGGLQNTVGIYLDEVPLGSLVGTPTLVDVNTFDMQRIEVLRGPQGVLFGSASLGGAVNYVSADPAAEPLTRVGLGVSSIRGGGIGYDGNAVASVPFGERGSGVRLAGTWRTDGGWVDNAATGAKNVNEYDEWMLRAKGRFVINDALSLTATAMAQQSTADDNPSIDPALGEDRRPTFVANARKTQFRFGQMTANATLSNSWSVIASAAYSEVNSDEYADSAALTPIFNFVASTVLGRPFSYAGAPFSFDDLDTDAWSTELRALYASEHVDVLIGGFYRDETIKYRGTYVFPGAQSQIGGTAGGLLAPNDLLLDQRVEATNKEKAAYVDVTIRPTARLALTAGARKFKNDITQDFNVPVNFSTPGRGTVFAIGNNEGSTTPKFSASYTISEAVLGYALYTKGYRAGLGNSPAAIPFGAPENVRSDAARNIELGVKTTSLDRRLIVNAAVYDVDWNDMQLTVRPLTSPVSFRDNVGQARSRGAELEVTALPTPRWRLTGAFSYGLAEIRDAGGALGPGSVPLRRGLRLPGSPRFSSSESVEYRVAWAEAWEPTVRVEHRYVGSAYSDILNTVEQGGFNVFNLRTSIAASGWRFGFDVDNAADSRGVLFRTPAGALQATFPRETFLLKPRTYRLTAQKTF